MPAPRPRADAYRHFVPITTRWMDNDVYRHVNNVVYYSFFDTTVNQYLIEQGALDVETSIRGVARTIESHANQPGLHYLDYQGRTVSW